MEKHKKKILSKNAWKSLGFISLVYVIMAALLVLFNLETVNESFKFWLIAVSASFSALKLNE